MRPNLVVIGAARAGTTSLHYYLGLHPDVAVARIKELNFFSHQDRWQLGAAWYEAQFTGTQKIHAEASPSYTSYPRYPEVPERIHALLPDARLIYIVRDPVERAYSNYVFTHADGREPLPLSDAIRRPDNLYVARSRYAMQLERYLRFYDPSRILIIEQEALNRDRHGTLRLVYSFLEIAEPPDGPQYSIRLNQSHHLRQRGSVGRALARLNQHRFVQAVPMSVRLHFGRMLYVPFSRPLERPPLTDDDRRYLVDELRQDAARFRSLTGRGFAGWTV